MPVPYYRSCFPGGVVEFLQAPPPPVARRIFSPKRFNQEEFQLAAD